MTTKYSDDTMTHQVWRSANGQLFRLATDEEVAAQIAYDATRPLLYGERGRPRRKSVKTHRDVVELGIVRAPLQHEPIGVGDKPFFNKTGGIMVVQVPKAELVEVDDIAAYLKESHRQLREKQRLAGK